MTEGITQVDVDEFHELLVKERKRLIEEALKIEDENITIEKEDLSDESDIATFEENQALHLRLKTREQVLIRKYDKALRRLNDGIYFDCEECGAPIAKKRLLVRLVTTMCISCKENQERGEVH